MDNPFPNQQRFCQSCGMPLSDEVVSENPDYCKYCHADGHFTQDCTMDEMIEVCVQFLDEFNKEHRPEPHRRRVPRGTAAVLPDAQALADSIAYYDGVY